MLSSFDFKMQNVRKIINYARISFWYPKVKSILEKRGQSSQHVFQVFSHSTSKIKKMETYLFCAT